MSNRTAEFRFYEELNDFLSSENKKMAFKHIFPSHTSIKDVIESLGVPHTEIDLILVNSQSVDFSYQPEEGDMISVYPVFESLDIGSVTHLRPQPLREPRFLLDGHLGKLARYLRLLGFDTLHDKNASDAEIVALAQDHKRIVLTRDVSLLKNKNITRGYWVRETDPERQIKEIINRFDLMGKAHPFTRCLECNGKLVTIDKSLAEKDLPEKTKNYFQYFNRCLDCQRIYWQGSHYKKLKKFVENL